ncbi:hypothetical protein SRABI96_02454 [Peribacillus sp. Bi96]|uniref:hypothetical protein n=1 Tax=Peribacillus sp. Bi96 TaxID=2884273 RepID=UPI001D6209D3|nr:hypothetical protein [Peribacillus sp. Bi96]CAH0222790.1 hypothetical protein SRABI96_02454 [Peribacillus sp. Bi96]
MGYERKIDTTDSYGTSVAIDAVLTKTERIAEEIQLAPSGTQWHDYIESEGFTQLNLLNGGSMYGYKVRLFWSIDAVNNDAWEDIDFTTIPSAITTRVKAPYVGVQIMNTNTVNANDISGVSLYFQAV